MATCDRGLPEMKGIGAAARFRSIEVQAACAVSADIGVSSSKRPQPSPADGLTAQGTLASRRIKGDTEEPSRKDIGTN